MSRLPSPGEAALALHLRVEGIPFEREVRLVPDRRWRWDFVVQDLAIEVQGGIWTRGGHSRGAGQERDFEKSNAAVKAGYRPLHYSTGMIESGMAIADILAAIR